MALRPEEHKKNYWLGHTQQKKKKKAGATPLSEIKHHLGKSG